jgi:murein DD-endopeptidase MepM/ murein hydrolase activator NlpD
MGRLAFHPLGPGSWPVTSRWRPPHRPGHRGVDLGVYKRPLYAGISGKALRKDQPGGAGYYVEIYAGNLMVSTFHMSRIDIANEQHVAAGQQIGVSGGVPGEPGAGNTDGAHLHFEIWENGRDTDPLPDLNAVASTGAPTPPPEEEDMPISNDEWARLEQLFKDERNHNYAIRDQAVTSIIEAIVRADADDATEEDVTRKRDELLAVIKPQLDRIEIRDT